MWGKTDAGQHPPPQSHDRPLPLIATPPPLQVSPPSPSPWGSPTRAQSWPGAASSAGALTRTAGWALGAHGQSSSRRTCPSGQVRAPGAHKPPLRRVRRSCGQRGVMLTMGGGARVGHSARASLAQSPPDPARARMRACVAANAVQGRIWLNGPLERIRTHSPTGSTLLSRTVWGGGRPARAEVRLCGLASSCLLIPSRHNGPQGRA